MTLPPPKIDPRTASDIARQMQDLCKIYVPTWQEFDPATGAATGVSGALIGVFARFAEIINQRLNQAPQKNFLALLDLLGAALLPPQPALVPLTFSLAAGSTVDGLVPVGTQTASPPAEGEKDPVIFETERELTVTAAQLAALFVRDPEHDAQADLTPLLASGTPVGEPVFQGNRAIEHLLYLGHRQLLGLPRIAALSLLFTLEAAVQDARELAWEVWDGQQWHTRTPSDDQTQHLTDSGVVLLGSIAPIPERPVDTIQNRWLRVRLLTPITLATEARLNMVRASQLPKVREALLRADLQCDLSQGLVPDAAFTNALPIDLGTDFFPFGDKPRLGDAFYLASAEAFSKDRAQGLAASGAGVQLDIQVANSHLIPTATSVRPAEDLQLVWECWNGSGWQRVGTSTAPTWLRLLEVSPPLELTADTSVTVEGRAQKGAIVRAEISGQVGGGTSRAIRVGDDGRFALTLSSPAGLIVVTFIASLGGRTTRAYATFFAEVGGQPRTSELTVQMPTQPVRTPTVSLVANSTAVPITHIRITNGSGASPPVPVVGAKGTALQIAVVEGRNELLIEGLTSATGTTVAATTRTISRAAAAPAPEPGTGFVDETYALCQSGIVRFTVPAQVMPTSIAGQQNFWLRVRLSRGDYGKDASYKLKNPEAPEEGFLLIPESFRPPVLSGVSIGYAQTLTAPPEVMLAYNNSRYTAVANAVQAGDPAFEPYAPAPEDRPVLYIGFALPAERVVFPNRTLSLYARVGEFKYSERTIPIAPDRSKASGAIASTVSHTFLLTNVAPVTATFTCSVLGTQWQPAPVVQPAVQVVPAGASRPMAVQVTIPAGTPLGQSDRGFLKLVLSTAPELEYVADFVTWADAEVTTGERLTLVWEYWNGLQWSALTVRDESENFTRPGLVEFLAPADFTARREFGQPPRHWLRVRWEQGEYALMPRIQRLLLNTTMAAQTVTLRNEILGSSDGSAGQQFRATRLPVQPGQALEVREPELPSAAEREAVMREEGADAITLLGEVAGRPREIWVRWHEVADFYASGPRSRHYVLDHLSGEVRCGDGLNGLIPPVGIGNIRLARYQIGGGSAGNRPAGTIVQLRTTAPYVDKVTNTEAAAGGADAESLESLLRRAPRTLRHGHRAVTVEDYEDLAMLATPEVARARCVPLRNLAVDALDAQPIMRGEVSVIVVPRSRDAKPLPSLELLSRVQGYLERYSIPTSHVAVVGPLYIRVDVHAEIALAALEGASAVEQAVQQRLASFLHPLTGGLDGGGWDFGRKPHRSDVYALIEAVSGVDHLRSLAITEIEDHPGVSATGRFLVFSGTHTIGLVFAEG